MFASVKSLFSRRSKFKFYGQFAYPVDKFIFDHYFPDVNFRGVCVECGAFDGLTECSCKFFEESLHWKSYNIEPLPWVFEKLCANRPNSINLNNALSNKTGTALFKAVDHPIFGLYCTNGSINHTKSHKEILKQMNCTTKEISVRCLSWDDFILQQKIDHIDLLVLDVEGHECKVLEGMNTNSILPTVLCVEASHSGLQSIQNKLSLLGYKFDRQQDVNAFFIHKTHDRK